MANILIVDDSKLIAHVAKTMLTKQGHEVILAQDGKAGIEAAKSARPDIILLDLIMPVMDGYEVCEHLKADEMTREIPIIMAETADKVKGLRMGALDYVTKPFDEAELVARVNIHLRLRELYREVRQQNRLLQEMANRDGLTGLYNHRYFHEQLSQDFLRAKRYHEHLTCVLLDIDFFKKFNDTYGHQTGDVVLKNLAQVIEASTRESDLAARYGGEEFALVMYHTDQKAALEAAERLRLKVESQEVNGNGNVLHVTISVGVATFPHENIHDAKELIEFADQALYKAKENGRNRVEAYEG